MRKNKIEWMTKIAMLSAAAMVLMLFEFPLPFIAPAFYELDFSEVPVLVGAFALGPVAGIAIEFLKILLNLLINGTITAGVGEFANFLVGVSFILPAEMIYRHKKNKKNAIMGMVVGSITMAVFAGFVNAFVLIPTYSKMLNIPMDAIVDMGKAIFPAVDSLSKLVLLCVVPFNLLKAVLVSVITAFIYKPLSPILKYRIKGKKQS
ncbi:MAG: ECF transporter S component [Clostridia bacterium]|nr:ECF transporter S component [Clostridia bacterium]